jgi:hypothetical protein
VLLLLSLTLAAFSTTQPACRRPALVVVRWSRSLHLVTLSARRLAVKNYFPSQVATGIAVTKTSRLLLISSQPSLAANWTAR